MRRSIATISLSGTLEEKLESVAAAGFDAVQVSDADILYFGDAPRAVRDIAGDLGLDIDACQPLRDIEGLDTVAFEKCVDRVKRKFDFMAELGAPLTLIPASTLAGSSADTALVVAQLRVLAEIAAERNLKLAYGPQGWAAHVRTLAGAWSIVQRVGHPHLDVFISSFHLLAAGGSPERIPDIPGKRIAALQLADAPLVSIDALSKDRFYSCFPGQGSLDLTGLLISMLQAGYIGPLTLEVHNDSFRSSPSRQIADDGMRSLRLLEESVRLADNDGKQSAKVALFDPPPPAAVSGVEFLEFAAAGKDADALGNWLISFGFRKLGKHRSKDVVLYRNGRVNVALNSEPNSFAYSYYLMHGPSVCAIGLRADDDQRALARAESYNAIRFEGRVGPNEMSIPAVRGPDGSLTYFVGEDDAKNLYEIEFVMDAKPTGSNAPLEAVDHLALSLPSGEMDSRVLFYRAVLGFESNTTWLLPDPNGLVKSRAVASKGHAVRIPLNVSQGQRTATARQVNT